MTHLLRYFFEAWHSVHLWSDLSNLTSLLNRGCGTCVRHKGELVSSNVG
jgi:hypothetical protein